MGGLSWLNSYHDATVHNIWLGKDRTGKRTADECRQRRQRHLDVTCFSEVKGWRQTGRSTWVLRPGSSECLATTSDMLGNGDSPPCIPKHVSCVEASCLLMPSTSLVCSSDVCSAFYFLRAVFEILHCLQKGLSTAAVVALQLWHHITSHNQGAKAKVKKNQHPSLSFVLGSFWAFCYCRIALLAHVQYTYTMCSDSKGFVWFEISVKTGSLISACAYLIWLDEFDLCWCSPAYLPNLPVESRDISQHYVVRSILDL